MAGRMRIGFWNRRAKDLWLREYRHETLAQVAWWDRGDGLNYNACALGGPYQSWPTDWADLSFKTLREAKEAAWGLVKDRAARIDELEKEKEG